ncbi:GntR family transcriptional regulator [Rhodococcus sp. (in: high G+C Gram-positive bacteria)]|uniref:GntR family transcriptional regulator n=1 Tax=Rhodococcus sp. TaxID=1831 RepID=UPI00257983E2|nr:GntR family transcriptional regulator [Rhodococcus sp. (in: high G+C Gram-positive bacteria)]
MRTVNIEHHAAPLRQQVLHAMRDQILDGTLVPGQRLRENTLCEQYGVSRTVIRESLRQLESEHLINVLPNRGPIVTVLSEDDIEAIYQVRRALEGLAGELFAVNASDAQAIALLGHIVDMEETYLQGSVESREISKRRFYELLLAGAGNEVLAVSLSGIHSRIAMFRRAAFLDDDRVKESMRELRSIVVAAAERRDPGAARAACESHIQLAGELAVVAYTGRLSEAMEPTT